MARLNAVIETSERARKSLRPTPPRVTIDTSFLQWSTGTDKTAEPYEAELAAEADERLEPEQPVEVQDEVEAWQREPAVCSETEARQCEEAARQEAEAQCEEAARCAADAQRELAALREAAEQRELAARRETEARQREEAARQEAAAQRELAARLEAEVLREQAARREAEAQREEAARCAAEAQRELAALREAAAQHELAARQAEARQREEAARQEAEVVREQPARREAVSTYSQLTIAKAAAVPDRASPLVAGAKSIVQSTPDRTANVDAHADPAGAENKRRDRRVASRMPATLRRESKNHALACTIRDRSSGGAKLEFAPDRYSDGITELVIGDKLSLTFSTAQECTSVACVVAWITGSRCGVRFSGQFHTQIINPRKTLKSEAAVKPTKPKLPSGAWRRPFARAD